MVFGINSMSNAYCHVQTIFPHGEGKIAWWTAYSVFVPYSLKIDDAT